MTELNELLNPPFLNPPLPVPALLVTVPAAADSVPITLNPASASALRSARLAFSAAFGSRESCLRSWSRLRCWWSYDEICASYSGCREYDLLHSVQVKELRAERADSV